MLALTEGASADLDRVRRRVRGRVPLLCVHLQRLLRLAEVGAAGPDPEAALPQLEAAHRSLAAFLKNTPPA